MRARRPPLRTCATPGCPKLVASWRELVECPTHKRMRLGPAPGETQSLRDYLRERKEREARADVE